MNPNSSDEEFVEEDALMRHAVYSNDVENLKRLITKYPLNNGDNTGCTLLHLAIERQRIESFNYLITLENINLASYNSDGETPLILACHYKNSYFAKRLIESGADVNQCTIDGTSPLHYAIGSCLETARLLLEKGADVNYMLLDKLTPLEYICMRNNYDAIHMLLYYGAVVSMVDYSILMICMAKVPLDCLETLLLHYLDIIDKVDLDFVSMIIKRKVDLFPVVLEKITEVDCNYGKLNCYIYDVEQLIALLKKFPGFREFFFREFPVSCFSLEERVPVETFSKLIFRLSEESLLSSDFLESVPGFITLIVERYKEFSMCKTELTELILILTSYGLPVCLEDFLYIHSHFGNGFLVKLFLHNTMEVPDYKPNDEWLLQGSSLMGVLLYKPNFDFNCDNANCSCEFMSGLRFELLHPISAFRYFANSKFHKFVSEVYSDNDDATVLLQQPHFPSLIELSRNALQKLIYSKYEISDETPGKYYDVVRRLQIPNYCKQILTFDVELYPV